jgi:hypothetical protein
LPTFPNFNDTPLFQSEATNTKPTSKESQRDFSNLKVAVRCKLVTYLLWPNLILELDIYGVLWPNLILALHIFCVLNYSLEHTIFCIVIIICLHSFFSWVVLLQSQILINVDLWLAINIKFWPFQILIVLISYVEKLNIPSSVGGCLPSWFSIWTFQGTVDFFKLPFET